MNGRKASPFIQKDEVNFTLRLYAGRIQDEIQHIGFGAEDET
jgi:hypothetical protein